MSKLLRITILSILALTSQAFSGNVYENLNYGDSRAEVTKKLLACPRVEAIVPETMLGRVGMNGSFKVKKDLNGLKYSLYFDWNDNGGLKEVTLRSEGIDSSNYSSKLKENFSAAVDLINRTYGTAIMSNDMPPKQDIKEGAILNSHLWHPGEGTLLLGVAHTQGKYHVSIRFVSKVIEPVRTEN